MNNCKGFNLVRSWYNIEKNFGGNMINVNFEPEMDTGRNTKENCERLDGRVVSFATEI